MDVLLGGAALAAVVHAVERVDNELQVRLSSPDSVLSGLLSAFALTVLALLNPVGDRMGCPGTRLPAGALPTTPSSNR